MILYTPLAQSDIFPQASDDFSNRQCISVEGKSFYVEQQSDGSYMLLQLLSTDPADYMNEKYTPGSIIQ
ncbi:hypothetical protein CIL03_03730 [Virgibacillus indicus]|uniref:Uncharacterized protein n=1 Tax=Virgibacillus indicus TaxID=2024554 RepID=A0A265NG70_9BACI|nr:YlzJ-like family protein [Virgibacillus indicus]OZU90266.1 hypothetical protein CIL03_03730 [Virgibacillus indicus]